MSPLYTPSGQVASGSIDSTEIADNSIVNADVNSAAAIADSKLSLPPVWDSYREVNMGFAAMGSVVTSNLATGTYLNLGGSITLVAAANTGKCAFYLNPADLATISGKTQKIRLRAVLITNAVAPGASVTFQTTLNPVATWGGASNTQPTIATLGAATASTNTITNPSAGAPSTIMESADVTFPTAGYYTVALIVGGATTAVNSIEHWIPSLQMRWA